MSDFQKSTAEKAAKYIQMKPVYMDTETTGLGAKAEVVEICIIDHDGEVLLNTLVKPSSRIPYDAVRIHGITDELVLDAPTWIHVWLDVENILSGRVVGIYNADFDLRIMKQNHGLLGMRWRKPASQVFCIMNLYSDFYGSRRWQSLERAGQQCGISLKNSHRALDDTLLARQVLLHMAQFSRLKGES